MLSMCSRIAAASAAWLSWVCAVTSFATTPVAGLAANSAAPRMNDRSEAREIRRIIIVASENFDLDMDAATLRRGKLRDNDEYVSGSSAAVNGHSSSCRQAAPELLWRSAKLTTP